MKQAIEARLMDALRTLGVSDPVVSLEHPGELAHGDYASGAPLRYAKELALNPREFAEKIVAAMGTIAGVEKIEIAGPGFINFTLSFEALSASIDSAVRNDRWGANTRNTGQKVMVEYTDPNPFKEFHIGHLMSNAIGESISRLLQFSGADIKRANYQGDVGPHVAKCLWGLKKLGLSANSSAALGEAYAAGAKAYEEDESAKAQIEEINKKVYEHTDSEIEALYQEGRATSLAHFEELYRLLGTKFDYYFFESASAPKGIALVQSHPEVFEASDGATVFKGEKVGLHTRVFLTSKGLPTYEAKDLGLLALKQDAGTLDESITVTAHEQADYFKVMLAAANELPEVRDIANKTKHVTHGMMRFAEGKMSSRTGNVVTGESLIEELRTVANERSQESRADDKAALADAVAVAGIKFQILRQSASKDIIFDRERALSLEGDSGPYLQYAYARASSIIQKEPKRSAVSHLVKESEVARRDVMRLISRFPDVVERASLSLEPHYVTTYLIQVASLFNRWYATGTFIVEGEISEQTYNVIMAVRNTLKNGLWILGIAAPEKM